MQPVISFWVLCNPFNLFGYYATRLIRFWVLCNPLCCFWVLCNPLYRFLGTMQPVSSYFFLWVLCNPILGTTKPVISLSDPSFCTTMQPVTLLQPIYFLSITTQSLISLSGTMTMQNCRVLYNLYYYFH